MRDRFVVALLVLFAILPSTALAENSKIVDSAKTLVDDPYYIVEGAVTSFRTCLGVANDHRAIRLWESDDPEIVKARKAGRRELVSVLDGLALQIKLSLGFGTIYTCAQVAEAWFAEGRLAGRDARMSGIPELQDGRRRHGTVVIDLDMSKSRALDGDENLREPLARDRNGVLRGSIEAVPLVRILTSPLLLPPRDFGGVVIRNAEIDGALLFYNVHLELPLAFANVRFRGYHYQKGVFGDDDDPPVLDTAIAIVNSRFSDHIQIATSEICGDIRLIDSRFSETITIRRSSQYGINCDPSSVEDAKPKVRVSTSSFEQGFVTVQADLGALHISGSDVHSLASSRSQFGRYLWIVESDVGSLQINCSILAEDVDISYNQIHKDFFIYGSNYGIDVPAEKRRPPYDKESCPEQWEKRLTDDFQKSIKIASNRIGGRLGLLDLDGALLSSSEINLTSNRVGNGSEIMLPAFLGKGALWHGRVNLEGSTYEGKVKIGVNEAERVLKSLNPNSGFCDDIAKSGEQRAIVDLKATRIRTLAWDLPFECHYRWAGYGLTYDLWLAGMNARDSIGIDDVTEDQKILSRWRETMARHQPAPLNTMSDYLAGKGSYVDSRSILLEAKRLNYAPTCTPDAWGLTCAGTMLATLLPSGSGSAKAAEGEPTIAAALTETPGLTTREAFEASILAIWESIATWLLDAWTWFWSFSMLFLLWPGGYGAQPERGLFLMAVCFGIFWCVYWRYSHWMKANLNNVSSLIEPLRPYVQSQSDGSVSTSSPKSELDDPQALFEHKPTTINELIRLWPKRTSWKSKGLTDEGRLQRVQEPLLEAVQSCEEHAQKTGLGLKELQELRKQLERFGNTETVGFSRFDSNKMPKRFTHWLYSVDTMLPVIDLHAYGNYYPVWGPMRAISAVQHVLGWWWVTVFIASAAIL